LRKWLKLGEPLRVSARRADMDEKQQNLKLGVVKIERDIITKAWMISTDRDIHMAGYLSRSLGAIEERSWSMMLRKADGGGSK
jgi:hypothetical protein